jgi:tetratricopeptide (TPR) repeat protein
MLETIHEFAVEQLEIAGADATRDRHADYAVEGAVEPPRSQRTPWIDSIGRSYGDFRAALEWLQARDTEGRFTTLVCGLAPYWDMVGNPTEAQRWIEAMLAASSVVTAERIRTRNLLSQALRLQGALAEARAQTELAQAEATELEDIFSLADAKAHRGAVEYADERFESARACFEEAIALLAPIDDQGLVRVLRHDLGLIALSESDLPRARALFELALEESIRDGHSTLEANVLGSLGLVALGEGRADEALARFREAFRLYFELKGVGMAAVNDAYGVAAALALRGEVTSARALVAAVDAHLERIGGVPEGAFHASARESVLGEALTTLSPSELEAAVATGSARPWEEAVAEALSESDATADEVDQTAVS